LEQRELLNFEKEVLGYYLKSHPLEQFMPQLKKYCQYTTADVPQFKDRQKIVLGGMIASVKHSNVKRVKEAGAPTRYVMFDLEDISGPMRCIQWPTEFATQGHLVQQDAIVVVQGTIDRRGGDEANLVIEKIIPLDQLDQTMTQGLCITVNEETQGEQGLKNVYEILRGFPGNRRLELRLQLVDGTEVKLKSDRIKVDVSRELCDRLEHYLGQGGVEMIVNNNNGM
jgi:DNA polymerase-3 subunit alpha